MTKTGVNANSHAMDQSPRNSRSDSAAQLKAAALRLFAVHGIDAVTVRQITEAAGQKNHAAVTYHFGSKHALIRELIVEGASAIDGRRNAWLDAAATDGGPRSVSEVVEGLVRTSISPAPPEGGECYNRFIAGLQISHRAMFIEALEGKWNSGYLRCLEHIRRLSPATSSAALNQRLVFLEAALGGIMAARERELADASRPHAMWSKDETLTEIAKALSRMIDND